MPIVPNMPNAEYHRHPAMSKTRLDLFSKDPNGPVWAENCPVDSEKIKTLDFGDAMHAICLEPDRLNSEFVAAPAFNLRTNAGKQEKADFYEENADKIILTAQEHEKLNLMFGSVMAHPAARRIIEAEGRAEHSIFWTDEDSGIECRCRPDKILSDFSVDVKTTPELKKFKFSVEDYRYHVQNAFYIDGMNAEGIDHDIFRFLVIQKTIDCGRYPVAVYTLPAEIVQYGRQIYKHELELYRQYIEAGQIEISQELALHHWFAELATDSMIEEIY